MGDFLQEKKMDKNKLSLENVNDIHNQIMDKMFTNKEKIPALKRKLAECEELYEYSYDEDEKKDLMKQIKRLKRLIYKLSNNIGKSIYQLKANDIFKKYREIINSPKRQLNKKDRDICNNTLKGIFGLYKQYEKYIVNV